MRLASIAREDLDQALLTLLDQPGVDIAPDADQASLKKADRTAALVVGGKAKHLLSIKDL